MDGISVVPVSVSHLYDALHHILQTGSVRFPSRQGAPPPSCRADGTCRSCLPADIALDHTVAEGVFICVFMPTATAAPVITSMLGGSISFVATYSLLCNLVVAFGRSSLLAAVGDNAEIGFLQSVLTILSKVAPLLLGPFSFLYVCGMPHPASGVKYAPASSCRFISGLLPCS